MNKIQKPKVSQDGAIRFYREFNPNGIFSNFYFSPITIDGKEWQTTEHYFQGMKFKGTQKEEQVRMAATPGDSFRLGQERNPKYPLRADWEKVKEDVMYRALYFKFTQHEDLKQFLLATNDCKIIEHTRNDRYWADGGDGSGKNILGLLLMELRDDLKEKKP